MSNSYINNLIKVTGPFLAEYVPVPISQKPETGCNLPPLTPLPEALIGPASPIDSSCCVPPFFEFPIIPTPFNPPENCPNGLTFEDSNVNILAQLGGDPVGQVTVGASQNADFCSYSLNIPDIIIPCFPAGPQFTGNASITIVDPNNETTSINSIGITTGQNCQFGLDGNINILLPYVPCQSGLRFRSDNFEISAAYGARAKTTVSGGVVTGFTNIVGGNGYLLPPKVVLTGGGGSGAIARAAVYDGKVTGVLVIDPGVGYTSPPTVSFNSVVDKIPVSINKNIEDSCQYDISLPPIVIPCYPSGPQVTGGITVNVKDPVTDVTTSTQNAAITTSRTTPCNFDLAGNINIDVPCQQNGPGLVMDNWVITDPFTDVVTALEVNVGKQDFCTSRVVLPPLNIPCYPGGISFDEPIRFLAYNWGSNSSSAPLSKQIINLTNETVGTIPSLRDPGTPCKWGGFDVELPFPKCDGGFVTTTAYQTSHNPALNKSFNVKIGGNKIPVVADPSGYTQYNTVQLKQRSETDNQGRTTCFLSLEGDIALDFPCPSGYSANTVPLRLVNPNKNDEVVATLALKVDGCTIGLTQTGDVPLPGLLPCATPAAPTTSIEFLDASGVPVSSNNQSNLTFEPVGGGDGSICNLKLQGKIQFPSSGAGMSLAPWNPYASPNTGSVVYDASTEGELVEYVSLGPTTPNDIPGASPKWEVVGTTVEMAPYKVIKTDTTIPSATANLTDQTVLTGGGQQDATVKVVPYSYLYNSEVSNTRIPVFGLDMPFILRPGEMVYLEVVYLYTNLQGVGSPTPLYGAICKGTAYDFTVVNSTAPIPADNNVPYKLFTRKNLTDSSYTVQTGLAAGDGSRMTTYINSSLNNYVGLDATLKEDLYNIQALAIKQIARQTSGSVQLLWQFKSFQVIAQATPAINQTLPAVSPANTHPVVPRNSGGTALSYDNGQPGKQYYLVKQQVTQHQVVKLVNTAGSVNIPIGILDDYNKSRLANQFLLNAADNTPTQPNCTIVSTRPVNSTTITTTLSGFDLNNSSSASANSNLFYTLTNVVSQTNLGIGIGIDLSTSTLLSVGTGPTDIKVYYCVDGHMPTINTYLTHGSSKRWSGTTTNFVNTNGDPLRRITWIAVHPEFVINDPRIRIADLHNPGATTITWL